MNKGELIEIVAKKTGESKQTCSKIFDMAKAVMVEVLKKGGEIEIRGFGKFSTKQTKRRLYRNPITRRQFYSEPKKTIALKLFDKFKYSIK